MDTQFKPLTTKMIECLCDLYSQSGGEVGVTYPCTAHWNIIEGLYKRGLIMRDAQIERGKVMRYVALTESGATYSCEKLSLVINDGLISDTRSQKCVSLFFEMDRQSHIEAYKHVGKLKAERNFRPTMIELLNIDEELERSETGLLEELYPEAMQSLRARIRQELELEYYKKIMTKLDSIQQPAAPVGLKASGSIGIKGIGLSSNAPLPPPTFDDDDDDMLLDFGKSQASGLDANRNLVNGLKSLMNS